MCCTSVMKWSRKGFGEPSCDIQVCKVGQRDLGLGYLESSTLWGKSFQYLLRGIVLTWAPGLIFTVISLVQSLVGRCKRILGLQMHSRWTGNLWDGLWFQHCWQGSHLCCPGSTGGVCWWWDQSDHGGMHYGKGCGRYCGTGYDTGCGGMTACWGTTCAVSMVSAMWSLGALVASSLGVTRLSQLPMLICQHRAV